MCPSTIDASPLIPPIDTTQSTSFPHDPSCPHLVEEVFQVTVDLVDGVLDHEFGIGNYTLNLPKSHARAPGLSSDPKVYAGYSAPLNDYEHLPGAQLFSVEAGSSNPREVYVLLAGYGWGTPAYLSTLINFIRRRSKPGSNLDETRFCLLDWMGTACSSRPKWDCEKYDHHDSMAAWHLDALRAWITQRGYDQVANGFESLVLVGHSVGGYYVARFSCQFKLSTIRRLVLLSPCGFAEMPDQFIDSDTYPIKLTIFEKIASFIQRRHITIMEIASFGGRSLASYVLYRYAKRRAGAFYNRTEKLCDLIHLWLVSNFSATSSADKGYYSTFVEIRAHKPIKQMLSIMRANQVDIYYGDTDWMPLDPCIATVSQMHNQFGGTYSRRTVLKGRAEIQGPRVDEGRLTYELSPTRLQPGTTDLMSIKVMLVTGCGHQLMLDNDTNATDAILGAHGEFRLSDSIVTAVEWVGVPCEEFDIQDDISLGGSGRSRQQEGGTSIATSSTMSSDNRSISMEKAEFVQMHNESGLVEDNTPRMRSLGH